MKLQIIPGESVGKYKLVLLATQNPKNAKMRNNSELA